MTVALARAPRRRLAVVTASKSSPRRRRRCAREAEPAAAVAKEQKDCEPTDPQAELKPLTFDERSIPEGMRLADEGYASLNSSRSAEIDKITREQQITDAVNSFITALAADPYNVKATYGLAAAYARIGRKQCSINLLTRILQMRPHYSQARRGRAARSTTCWAASRSSIPTFRTCAATSGSAP